MEFKEGQIVQHAHSNQLLEIISIKDELVKVGTRSTSGKVMVGWFPIDHIMLCRKDKLDEI